MKRAKRIGWVSLAVDAAIMSVAISRVLIHREYARLPKGSLAHLLEQHVSRFDVPVPHAQCVEVGYTHYDLPTQPETLRN